MQTENAEMYLVTMALLEEQGTPCPIPLPSLAEALEVQVVSVNQMVRKLEDEGLVSYQPYKGVSFSQTGGQYAYAFLRHRRLWETFFVEHLGYTPQQADALACRMEHINEFDMADRLSDFLDNPVNSPTGKPIAQPGQPASRPDHLALSQLQPGQSAQVVSLPPEIAVQEYFQAQGINLGSEIRILAVSDARVWLISTEESTLSIVEALAGQILVSPLEAGK